MDCKQFELALADQPNPQLLPTAAKAHLQQCEACSNLVADFATIAQQVADLAPAGPPSELWPEIREQLLREGIIHEGNACSGLAPHRPKLVRSTSSSRR